MYLIELLIKKWKEKNNKKSPALFEFTEQEEDLFQNCERHLYMPIDSTCDYLACKNCGHIIRNDNGKKNNNFHAGFDNF